MSTGTSALRYDPFDLAVRDDPYPHYARLRAEAPVYHVEEHGFWVLSRYDDVARAARDHESLSSAESIGVERQSEMFQSLAERFGIDIDTADIPSPRPMIATDPPDHTRLRKLVIREFVPPAVARRQPQVQAICDRLVDDLVAANGRGEADIVQHVAAPLPALVIIDMLGVPPEDHDQLKEWTEQGVHLIGGAIDPALQMTSIGAGMNLFSYFDQIIAERRQAPRDDLISLLLREEDGQVLSHEELIGQCVLVLVGGHETTTNLIGNAFKAFFAHPDQLGRVRRDPSLVPGALEEVLRWDAPVQGLFRDAVRDVEIAGTVVPAGSRVQLLWGSANRDGDHYPDPDAFLIDRAPRDHFGFGHGIHYCVGAHLARLEAKLAVETILRRTGETLCSAGESQLNYNLLVRGPRTLPVAF